MAYVDFTAGFSMQAAAPRPLHPEPLPPFAASIVALARGDSIRGLNVPGRIARALGRLFGLERPAPLADPALEAMRRVAVHFWHNREGVPAEERDAFHAAGFSGAQFAAFLTLIATARAAGQRSIAA